MINRKSKSMCMEACKEVATICKKYNDKGVDVYSLIYMLESIKIGMVIHANKTGKIPDEVACNLCEKREQFSEKKNGNWNKAIKKRSGGNY